MCYFGDYSRESLNETNCACFHGIGMDFFKLDSILQNGILVAVKGYKNDITWEELDKKLDELDKDTKISCLVVVVALGKCTSASYFSGTAAEVEAKINDAMLKD